MNNLNQYKMKYAKLLCFTIFLGFLQVSAQKTTTESDQVASAVTELYKAMVDRNEKELEKLTAEDLTYGHSSGELEDKEAYIHAVVQGPYDYLSITAEDQTITVTGKNAVVRHRFIAKANNDGEPSALTLGVLMVYQKQGKAWKLLARQGYKL